MENPIKMDDLGVPLFSETSIYVLECHIDKDETQIGPRSRQLANFPVAW